jgi:hypothetical protein
MQLTAEFVLNAIGLLSEQGATLPEAVSQFSQEQLRDAMFSGEVMEETQRALLDTVAKAGAEESNDQDFGEAITLWMAGWTHELVEPNIPIMAWYWRAPAKAKRPKGRLYRSTGQAFPALYRQQQVEGGAA